MPRACSQHSLQGCGSWSVHSHSKQLTLECHAQGQAAAETDHSFQCRGHIGHRYCQNTLLFCCTDTQLASTFQSLQHHTACAKVRDVRILVILRMDKRNISIMIYSNSKDQCNSTLSQNCELWSLHVDVIDIFGRY